MSEQMPPVPPVPTTSEEAVEFLRWCETHIGTGFHIDTSGIAYVVYATGEPLFTPAEADRLDDGLDACCRLLDDPYAVSLDLFHEINNIPRED